MGKEQRAGRELLISQMEIQSAHNVRGVLGTMSSGLCLEAADTYRKQ